MKATMPGNSEKGPLPEGAVSGADWGSKLPPASLCESTSLGEGGYYENLSQTTNYTVIGVRIMAITYHDLYLNTCKAMGAMGIEANRLEARELLCAAAGKTPEKLLQDLNLYTTDEIAAAVEQMLQRREAGEPIAYIVGEWSFLGLTFDVGPQVLIPRVDTEVLAQRAINCLKEVEGNTRSWICAPGPAAWASPLPAVLRTPGPSWWTCPTGPWTCARRTSADTTSPAGWST